MLEAGLVGARFLHYIATLSYFGAALFSLSHSPAALTPVFLYRLRLTAAVCALAALCSGGLWLLFSVATMADNIAGAMDPSVLWSILRDTAFGHLWIARAILGGAALLVCIVRLVSLRARFWDTISVLTAGLLLASIAGTGHTQSYSGATHLIHMGADAAHLLAAGAWLGGLVAMARLVAPSSNIQPRSAHTILARFSAIGTTAVLILIGSGLVNSWLLVGRLGALFDTAYGQLLLVKICLFGAMIAVAGLNRFWLVPRLAGEIANGQSPVTLDALRRSIFSEQALGVLVIAIVSLLGTMQPVAGPA
jgi:putative copper resistance protein D